MWWLLHGQIKEMVASCTLRGKEWNKLLAANDPSPYEPLLFLRCWIAALTTGTGVRLLRPPQTRPTKWSTKTNFSMRSKMRLPPRRRISGNRPEQVARNRRRDIRRGISLKDERRRLSWSYWKRPKHYTFPSHRWGAHTDWPCFFRVGRVFSRLISIRMPTPALFGLKTQSTFLSSLRLALARSSCFSSHFFHLIRIRCPWRKTLWRKWNPCSLN